ncbi:hypothetical protein [Cognatishimia sp. MH4019]|uniref:hypothetical protein n=1 Tax=Cognatishimia sp. MH4019 TaxID=2854030 RepID=UPI001CD6E7F1|nr:hypothetical protein [Cognatishimia sp. MH4019]
MGALILSACASLNPAGMIAASSLDPVNTPPSQIQVAVGVPDTVSLADGDAVFRIAFGYAQARVVDESVPLQLRPSADGQPAPNAGDEVIYLAQFSDEDAARVAAAQAKIRALKEQGSDGTGSLSVSITGGCLLEPELETLPLSTWLRTNPDGAFVQLTERVDVFEVLNASEATALRSQLGRCE